MSKHMLLRSPLANRNPAVGETGRMDRCAEVAGGTAAECAAICCCCPCTVMNVLVLAVYRVPAGICRKAWTNQKKRILNKRRKSLQLQKQKKARESDAVEEVTCQGLMGGIKTEEESEEEESEEEEDRKKVVDLDGKMWDQFFGTGFWRSQSTREE